MQNSILAKYRDVLEYLKVKKTATVAELTSIFFLSESTMRRILSTMEDENLVVRFHGGAAINNSEPVNISSRKVQQLREKAAIGNEAASMVEEGMTIIMLGGTTVHAMCPYLKGKQITVITTSIPVINDLLQEERMKLIQLGGLVNPPELETRGSLTAAGLEKLHADILFIGATNIHPTRGLMTDDSEAVVAYRACLAIADKSVVLADSTKFRSGGVSVVAGLMELSLVITDAALPQDIANDLAANGLQHRMVDA